MYDGTQVRHAGNRFRACHTERPFMGHLQQEEMKRITTFVEYGSFQSAMSEIMAVVASDCEILFALLSRDFVEFNNQLSA